MKITIKDALLWGVEKLKVKGVELPRLDAEVLLAHVLGLDRTQLYVNIEAEITERQDELFRLLIERRGLREPVFYLTGSREFMSLDFAVGPEVLIPRPETELLVDKIISLRPEVMIDVGTGSGAIAISTAKYLPGCHVVAIDVSKSALEVAQRNAKAASVSDRVRFLQGHLLTPVIGADLGPVDLIAANLPYIPQEQMSELPDEVRLFEPSLALDGGRQGLDLYKELINQVSGVLKPGGQLLMEIGYDQAALLRTYLLPDHRFTDFVVLKDFADKDRVVGVTLTKN